MKYIIAVWISLKILPFCLYWYWSQNIAGNFPLDKAVLIATR